MKPSALILLTFAALSATSAAWAACNEGQRGSCVRNGCNGVRECVGGRMLGCEVPESCLRPPPKDRIVVDLVVPGSEIGILYDGTDAQGSFNDRSAVVAATSTSVTAVRPNILGQAFGNSAIVFGRSRQPARVPARWTTGADMVYVQLENNIRFNVTFWILAGPFATQQTRAAAAVLAVNSAYGAEKAGLRIAFVTINDATTNPNAMALLNGGTEQQFRTNIGANPREINVYVISNVNGGANSGANFDGTPTILLGSNALTFPQLLQHEIGHAFVLWHTNGLLGFDGQNVMNSIVSGNFLTEGQTFRMHFHPSSQVNVFGLRPGRAMFVCGEPATNDCPANNRRLWADGAALPPN